MNLPEHVGIIAGFLGLNTTKEDDGTEYSFTMENILKCAPDNETEEKAIDYLLRYCDQQQQNKCKECNDKGYIHRYSLTGGPPDLEVCESCTSFWEEHPNYKK